MHPSTKEQLGITEEYDDFGWANGWKENPPKWVKCRELNHQTFSQDFGPPHRGLENVEVCHICKYYYMYDSSD